MKGIARKPRVITGIDTPAQIAAMVAMAMAFIGFMYGLRCSFFRSADWSRISIGITALVSLLVALSLLRLARNTGLRGIRLNLFHEFMLVAYALPDIYTRYAGQPIAMRDVEFSKVRSYGRGSCGYQVRATDFARSVEGNYCAGPNEFDALPNHGLARAYARRSWLGRHVYFVEPEPLVPKPINRP